MPHTYTWTPEAIKATPSSTVQIRTWDNQPVPEAFYTINNATVTLTVPTQNRYKVTLSTNGDTETARLDIPQAQNSTSLEERIRSFVESQNTSSLNTELYQDFRNLSDGKTPNQFDSGQPFTYAAEKPIISNGAFVTPTPTTSGRATYLETELRGRLTRVGAEFIIRRTSETQTNGALALGAWSDPGVVASYPNGYPVAGAHFVINKDRWTYNFYAHADNTDIASGTFSPPLPENTPLTVELFFEGPKVVIVLPDGSKTSFSDPRADEYIDSRAFWEPFMQGGSGNTNVAITQVWADSDANKDKTQRYATTEDVAKLVFSSPNDAYTVQWRPTADQYKNLTTTQTSLHSSVYIDFPLPTSKQFIVSASALYERVGSSTPYWAFTANTSVTLGVVRLDNSPSIDATGARVAGIFASNGQLFVDLSNDNRFTVGSTIRIGWSHYMSGTDRITFQARNGGYPTMTVLPVNGRVVTVV